MSDLGPATELRFAEAFADSALLTAARAAKLLGIDAKTLRSMTLDGLVVAVRRGRVLAYTESGLRDYLANASPDRMQTATLRPPPKPLKKYVGFTEVMNRKRSTKARAVTS